LIFSVVINAMQAKNNANSTRAAGLKGALLLFLWRAAHHYFALCNESLPMTSLFHILMLHAEHRFRSSSSRMSS